MENHLSFGSWMVIGVIAVILITLNLSLLTAWIKKDQKQQSSIWQEFSKSLGKSWTQDDKQMQELSQHARRFRNTQHRDQDDSDKG